MRLVLTLTGDQLTMADIVPLVGARLNRFEGTDTTCGGC